MAQDGKCAICSNPQENRRLAVDHCHKTGKVRGLLCQGCNTGIGGLKDDTERIKKAIDYLKKSLEGV